jgi:hypothetical protein
VPKLVRPAPQSVSPQVDSLIDDTNAAVKLADVARLATPQSTTVKTWESPPQAPHLATTHPPISEPYPGECYASFHLELLYHFEHGLFHETKALHPGLIEVIPLFLQAGFTAPYLMDEILAYSAAHKSTVDRQQRQHLLAEATRLQTRALTLYNAASLRISEETCLPMFIYSSLLSHHIIFDIGANISDDLGEVIEGLTRSIGIHRGLISIAKMSWPMFSENTQQLFIRSCKRDYKPTPSESKSSRGECGVLLERLNKTDLTPSSIAILRNAVGLLQEKFDSLCLSDSHSMWSAVQDWLVAVPTGYIELLNQRRPEALVVFAHFAIMLHHVAEHWFVGDLGMRLVHLINNHLGPFWADWLEWPNQMATS